MHFISLAANVAVADGDASPRRIGKHFHQEIEQRGAADVVQRGRQHHRINALGLESVAQPFHQVFHRQRALLEELLHQRVVALGDHFHQCLMRSLGGLGEFPGNLLDFRFAIAIRCVNVRLHRDQVHDAMKTFLRADRQLHGNHVAAKHARQRLHRAVVTRQLAVHPVDRERARQVILDGVVPDLLRYHLDSRERVHDDQRRVRSHQRRARIVNERAVTRRIQKIDFYFFALSARRPFGIRQPRMDRNFSGDLFFVPVGDGVSLGNLSQPIGHPGCIQQGRHQLRFSGVAVTGNSHIAYGLRCIGFHFSTPWRSSH